MMDQTQESNYVLLKYSSSSENSLKINVVVWNVSNQDGWFDPHPAAHLLVWHNGSAHIYI